MTNYTIVKSSEILKCKFCNMAEKLLTDQKITYKLVSLTNDKIKDLSALLDRDPSVPITFYNTPSDDTSILLGGYDDLNDHINGLSEETLIYMRNQNPS